MLRPPLIRLEWRDAGLPLGNHTWSHMDLNQRSLVDWEADVLKDEPNPKSYTGNADWQTFAVAFAAGGKVRRWALGQAEVEIDLR